MTTKSSKLNKDDIKYLLDILHDEEQRQYGDIEIRDNVGVAKVNLERLQRIKLAVLDLNEEWLNSNKNNNNIRSNKKSIYACDTRLNKSLYRIVPLEAGEFD